MLPPPPLQFQRVHSEVNSKQLFGEGGSSQSIEGQATTPWPEPQLQLHFLQRPENNWQTSCSAPCPACRGFEDSEECSRWQTPKSCSSALGAEEWALCHLGGQYTASLGHAKHPLFTQSLLHFYFSILQAKEFTFPPTPNTHILPQYWQGICLYKIEYKRIPTVLAKYWSLLFQIKKKGTWFCF